MYRACLLSVFIIGAVGAFDNSMNVIYSETLITMEENESLNRLYPKKGLNDDHWVLARWLEILPIELNVKNAFVVCYSFNDAKAFVESVILE